jgi:hypothetical protein
MATHEKTRPAVEDKSTRASSGATTTPHRDEDFAPRPMFHHPTHHSVDIEDYFRGPRDINRHSKWPSFLRLHGSIMPKMIIPLLFIGGWATMITSIHELVRPLGINSVLLTVTGFVVGLALSFRSTTAYERFSEGRRYWQQLVRDSRHMARLIWVHVQE